ncbi:MAG: biopolymer transporter ExbD [Candidatus Fibromonas sp.]|nr:biopolymer transporter ExbD [Candidatus Fibromonas sp.]
MLSVIAMQYYEHVNPPAPQIKIDRDAIFVGKREIVKTAVVAERNSFLVELFNVLKSKRANELGKQKIRMQIEPDIKYNILYKVLTACAYTEDFSGIHITSKIDGKYYTETINMAKDDFYTPSCPKEIIIPSTLLSEKEIYDKLNKYCTYFNIFVGDSLEILTRYGRLPGIPHESLNDEFAETLIRIRKRFIDSPDAEKIFVIAYKDTEVFKVIQVMSKARAAGFTKIYLATLGDL